MCVHRSNNIIAQAWTLRNMSPSTENTCKSFGIVIPHQRSCKIRWNKISSADLRAWFECTISWTLKILLQQFSGELHSRIAKVNHHRVSSRQSPSMGDPLTNKGGMVRIHMHYSPKGVKHPERDGTLEDIAILCTGTQGGCLCSASALPAAQICSIPKLFGKTAVLCPPDHSARLGWKPLMLKDSHCLTSKLPSENRQKSDSCMFV